MKLLFNLLAVILLLLDNGASGVGTVKVLVSLKEGDSVIFHTGVKTNQQNHFTWHFNNTRIAKISENLSHICTDVQCNKYTERFRDRLKLDHQTGSLTIMNTRTTDAGLYKLLISSSSSNKIFNVAVNGVSAAERNQIRHVIVGEPVTLESGETNIRKYLKTWYFNDILIAEITGHQKTICTDVQCKERFRDRLKMNQETGSLTISNINITDSGLYELKIVISSSSFCITRLRRFNVTVFFPAVGICVAVVFLLMVATVTAGVIYCRHKKYKPQIKKIRMMLISRHRIQTTLLKGLGMTLNQNPDEDAIKTM